MEVFLVRHTRVAVAPDICYGISDVPLADTCKQDIRAVALQLSHLPDPVVYSSPLKRCRILAEEISSQIIFDDRLKELNFGKWEMQPWPLVTGPEADSWMNDFVNVRCPGGESHTDLSLRVRSFLADLLNTKHQTAIVVTHGGVIRTILALIQNTSLYKSFEIQVQYGQVIPIMLDSIPVPGSLTTNV